MARRPLLGPRAASTDSTLGELSSGLRAAARPRGPSAPPRPLGAPGGFDQTPLAEYLALDARPTFVLAASGNGELVYANPALHQATGLLGRVREALRAGAPEPTGKEKEREKEKTGKDSARRKTKEHARDHGKSAGPRGKERRAPEAERPEPDEDVSEDDRAFLAFLFPPRGLPTPSTTRWDESTWRRAPLGSGWVVVHCETSDEGGNEARSASQRPNAKRTPSSRGEATSPLSAHSPASPRGDSAPAERAMVDWTRADVAGSTPYVQFLRGYDWASTPLGPMDSWTWELRSSCLTLMADPSPSILLWGPQMTIVYNHACVQIFGDKHPHILGGRPTDAFGELWSNVEAMVERVHCTGKPWEHKNLCLPLQRHGAIEETFWTFTILPIVGPDGRVCAIYDRFIETTNLNVSERRQNTLARLGELGGASHDLPELWRNILAAIGRNATTPYAAIYSVSPGGGKSTARRPPSPTYSLVPEVCSLAGSIGLSDKPAGIPRRIDLSDSKHGLAAAMREAWRTNEPVLMCTSDGSLPEAFQITKPSRGYPDACTRAAVIPIRFAAENSLVAFIIHGLNPRRPYDNDYKGYLALMHTRVIELAAGIFLPEEDRRTQAALREETLRQATLASRLLSKTHDAEQKQMRFMRLAQNAPIGMVMYDAEGKPLFYNDAYFEMTGQRRETFTPYAWLDAIHPDDRVRVQNAWRQLIEEGIPVTIEHRVTKPWRAVDPVDGRDATGETWLLSSAFPEITGDASVATQIMGWVIDISHQKWAEKLQQQRLEDALENKRQSENFIDMTSHEMRNPLSAILQSADGIHGAVNGALGTALSAATTEALQTIAENARTIVLCAQHQKRIVDDILTLSKLDSDLLLITPDAASPIAIVRHVLKMYEAELLNAEIEASVSIDPSYTELRIQHVLLDPSRLLQVLINLLTNAIKFTQFQRRRHLTVYLAASRTRPTHGPNDAAFFPPRLNRNKSANNKGATPPPEDADAEPLYLTFAVQDSGRGLSAAEQKMLFHRFSQANPRTHVQYGGSGLGLFISRELTELQGGQIGVSSALGHGSTFAFYVRTLRCTGDGGDYDDDADADASAAIPPRVGLSLPSAGTTTTTLRPAPALDRTASAPAAVPVVPADPGSLHVLIVEDNVINQRVMAKQLQRSGCVVHVANHGAEALEFIWRTKLVVLARSDSGCDVSTPVESPDGVASAEDAKGGGLRSPGGSPSPQSEKPALDVILMDVEMPVMDGLTCVTEIRALERAHKLGRHVPIICITANAREAQVEEALGVGCDRVVTKPFRIPELLPQMHALVEEWRGKS